MTLGSTWRGSILETVTGAWAHFFGRLEPIGISANLFCKTLVIQS